MAKKKQFFIKGKDIITDASAPVVSNEFLDKREDGDYTGQTLEVQSDTKLEEDTGIGEAIVMRTYEFRTNPELLKPNTKFPTAQEFFNDHMKGISGLLWSDGLRPAEEVAPRIIFTKDKKTYLIMVWARPGLGQSLLAPTQTLSEIIHGRRQDRNEVQRSVSVSPTKKAKTSRTTKAPK